MGRPSKYSESVADAICHRLMAGDSMRAICTDPAMPSRMSVYRWLAEHEEFRDRYARARNVQADCIADDILAIADDVDGDVQRDRLRVDARKWLMAKLAPTKYGPRAEIVAEGVAHHLVVNFVDSDEEAD